MKKAYLYILAYFFLGSIVFVFLIPPFEANDEPYHLEYINYIVKNSSLPNQLKDNEKVHIEGHQFPLYYALTASVVKVVWGNSPVEFSLIYNKKHFTAGGTESLVPVFSHVHNDPFSNSKSKFQFYFLRLLSTLFSTLNLFFVYKIAGLFFKEDRLALLCMFFAASIPQVIYASSTITNDSLSNLLASASIYTFLLFLKESTVKRIVIFSLVFAFSLLCKKTLFFLIPSVVITSAYSLHIGRLDKAAFTRFCSYVFIFTLVVAGWFYYRNHFMYNDILLTEVEKITVPMHYDPKPILSMYFIYPFIPGLFGSFFGVFGWMNVAIPFFIYVFYFILTAFSVFGISKNAPRQKFTPMKLFIVCSLTICLAGVVYYNLSYSQHQGRFLFPVISLVAILIISGLNNFFANFNKDLLNRNVLRVFYTLLILINVISVYVLYRFYYIENNYL
ncbi:MAG: DUF2142 domain-containing protein [Ignavibacteria bacterium]|nr:DUF2142 domain-containing protein [Ignavibacteria bacterium]